MLKLLILTICILFCLPASAAEQKLNVDGSYVFHGALSDENLLQTPDGQAIDARYNSLNYLKSKLPADPNNENLKKQYDALILQRSAELKSLRTLAIKGIYLQNKDKIPEFSPSFMYSNLQLKQLSLPFKYWVAMLVANPGLEDVFEKTHSTDPKVLYVAYKASKQPSDEAIFQLDHTDSFCTGIRQPNELPTIEGDAAPDVLIKLIDY